MIIFQNNFKIKKQMVHQHLLKDRILFGFLVWDEFWHFQCLDFRPLTEQAASTYLHYKGKSKIFNRDNTRFSIATCFHVNLWILEHCVVWKKEKENQVVQFHEILANLVKKFLQKQLLSIKGTQNIFHKGMFLTYDICHF